MIDAWMDLLFVPIGWLALFITPLGVILLYIGTLVWGGVKTKHWSSRIALWALLLGPAIYKGWDMPVGYSRYKALCLAEGGMRAYVDKPRPAKRLRLQGSHFGDDNAAGSLNRWPTLASIEAPDSKYGFTTPPAMALYERGPDGGVVSRMMDTVKEVPSGFNVIPARSEADYTLSYSAEKRPIRTGVERYTLRRADGAVIATTTRIYHFWTDPNKTVLAKTRVEECGAGVLDYFKLVDLVAERGNSERREP